MLGFGFFGISVVWPLYNAYVPIFLKDFELSSTLIGLVMTIDNIFAIVLLPIIGVLSDQTRTRIGRRMPYILIGAPLAAVTFALIPAMRALRTLWLMMLTIIVMNFSMAIFRSPVIALMPDVTPPKYRSQANGVINFMGGLGALLAFFAGKPLYDRHYGLPFLTGAALMLFAQLLVVAFVREPAEYRSSVGARFSFGDTYRRTISEMGENLRDVFTGGDRSLFMILLSILLWFIGYNAIETFFTSFAKFRMGISESTGALILGFFSLTFMLFSIPAGFLGAKFGRKRVMTLGLSTVTLILVLATVLGLLVKSKTLLTNLYFVLFAIGGLGWALVNVNSLPTVVDMTDRAKAGGYTGLYYLFSMSANIIAPPVAGFFIDLTGYDSLMVFAIVFFVLSAITVQFVRRGDLRTNTR